MKYRAIQETDCFLDKTFNCDNRDIFRQLPDNSVDLIVTDPPYKDYQSNRPVAHKRVREIKGEDFDLPFFISESARVLKPGCHFYCWCDHLTFPDIVANIRSFELEMKKIRSRNFLTYKNCLVWIKNNHGSGDLKGNYAPQHEFVIYAAKGKRRELNSPRPSNILLKRDDNGDIGFYSKVSNYRYNHGTSKPVEIHRLFIEKSSQPGELVFDPYAGSMPTGEACIMTGRHYLLVELITEHYAQGVERLRRLENQYKLP